MLHRATLTLTHLEGRDVPSTSPVLVESQPLDSPTADSTPATTSDDSGSVAALLAGERITEALIDFAKLPAAGTGYALKITVTGTRAEASQVVNVDNTQGTNSPTDTRNAVKTALEGQFPAGGVGWKVEAVGDTKLKITYWKGFQQGGGAIFADIKDLKIAHTGLKDNQLPTYSTTRVAPPPASGLSGTVGGTWTLGFAANEDADVLFDDVLMTITLTEAGGPVTVEVTLTEGMTAEMAAEEVANQLTAAGFASYVIDSTVMYDDPSGQLDSVEVEYTSLGTSPPVNWLTQSTGFNPTP